MERRELDELERFFTSLGHRTPLAYYGLPEDAPADVVDAAIKKRRTWAQGQQANPKYRTEALFLIKSNALIRRCLLEEREAYAEVFGGGGNPKLVELTEFIRQTFASGWTPAAEAAIRAQGKRLELEEGVVEARLTALARELNLTRQGDEDLGALGAVDVYELLQVSPTADTATLEAAYRNRYRWARTLRDLEKSSKVLAMLDAAWRIVCDPERRAAYDAHREEVSEPTEEVARGARELDELLRDTAPAPAARSSEAMLDAVRTSARAGGGEGEGKPASGGPPPLRLPHAAAPPPAPPRPAAPPVAPRPPPSAAPPPRPSAPPAGDAPVPNIQGRTIGLAQGPQMVRERAPKLAVPARSPVRLQLPRSRVFTWTLRVQNAGQGRMPGRLTSDQPWLVPSRDWLDPLAKEQEIPVELNPALLKGNTGNATLTVVTDHGERRTVAFVVTRANFVAPLLGLLVVVGLGGGAWFGWQQWQADHQPPAPPVAHLRIRPPAEHVRVNGVEVGHGGEKVDVAPPARGTPFRLEVSAAGLLPVDQMVTVGDTAFDVPVTLHATPELEWAPTTPPPAGLPPGALDVVQAHAQELSACVGGKAPELVLSLRIGGDGEPRGFEASGTGVDVAGSRSCIAHVLAPLRFPAFEAAWAAGDVTVTLRPPPMAPK